MQQEVGCVPTVLCSVLKSDRDRLRTDYDSRIVEAYSRDEIALKSALVIRESARRRLKPCDM
jgi:hypothetical protein